MYPLSNSLPFFFFNDTATTEIYTLSLHDALPIWAATEASSARAPSAAGSTPRPSRAWPPSTATGSSRPSAARDRKSTRLKSSHGYISYAVFCLKKKKQSLTRVSVRLLTHSDGDRQ